MTDKLEKLAVKLSGLIKNSETYQDIYNQLIIIINGNLEYFKRKKKSDIIKLVFFIMDYLKTGSFNHARRIQYDLLISGLILKTEEKYESDCRNCLGGTVDCDFCGGIGTVSCNKCGGDGEIEYDGIYRRCDKCDDDGEVDCDNCNGNGTFICDFCYGEGYVDTDKNIFEIINILSWSNSLNYELEKNANKPYPVISVNRLLKNKDYIVLYQSDTYFEDKFDLSYDHYYCIGTEEDLDKLQFSPSDKLYLFDQSGVDFFRKD